MAQATAKKDSEDHPNRKFLVGLARAFAGAVLFSFPLVMTMEMWALGVTIEPLRLAVFMLLAVPLLVGLSYYIGFEETSCLTDDIVDAFVAYAVGFITSALLLLLFGIVNFQMSLAEIIGIISMQAVISAIGALLAQSQLGGGEKDDKNDDEEGKDFEKDGSKSLSYGGEIFLMGVGAIFLAMNPAPTEEIVLIGYKMSDFQIIALAVLTIILMHAFVYKVEFRGQETRHPKESSAWSVFLRYTITGYALVLLISFYLIWTFGHLEGQSLENIVKTIVVMSFPGALGAAASRLIL
jgi:putative integral membrane protein (TIGR02587 family)